ncbi:uncharacterized protein LOC131627882 [Vicia villosa]|uniref:uncharacterized protein LOC131627882 n=1 Tax=Vicia villosa TaxID=3911 RepID=UPI00273B72E9|nr:uncharacterized protein LOC131627882 [Vicia villosa]
MADVAAGSNYGSELNRQLLRLQQLLDAFNTVSEGSNEFEWNLSTDGDFIVASIAEMVDDFKDPAWTQSNLKMLKALWNLQIPPKFKIFMWRVIISRMPTKDQLLSRGVTNISNNLFCEFCAIHLETLHHLFVRCQVTKMIWEWIFSWIGNNISISLEELIDFGAIQEKVKNAIVKNKINIIWIAIICTLWLMRKCYDF